VSGARLLGLQTLSATIKGAGSTNNTLYAPTLAANQGNLWSISGTNAGTLNGSSWSFTGVQNLVGCANANDFVFANAAKVTGNVSSGGPGTVDLSQYTTNVNVNLATNTWTGVGGTPSGIATVIGGSGSNTLTASNTTNTWSLNGPNSGNLDGTLAFS